MKTQYIKEMRELNRLAKEEDRIYTTYAANCGVSETVLCISYSLYTSEEEITQKELCKEWGYPPQTINTALKSMENNGYVELVFTNGNRKVKKIHLTQKGEQLAEQIVVPLINAENEAFLSLSQAERENLLLLTQKHLGFLKTAMEKKE